jgi:hypothetical protein
VSLCIVSCRIGAQYEIICERVRSIFVTSFLSEPFGRFRWVGVGVRKASYKPAYVNFYAVFGQSEPCLVTQMYGLLEYKSSST